MISNLTNTGDIRIVPFTRTIISKLPDKDAKVKLFKALNSDIMAVRNTPNRSTIDKDQKILEICQNAISVVYDHVIREYVLRETTVILPMTQDPTEEDDTDADSVQTPDTDY
jgi:predicted metal-dependent TIM-barrel fold hydrolase